MVEGKKSRGASQVSTDSHRVKLRIHTNHVSVDVDDYRTDGGVTVKKRTTLDENREWLAGWLALCPSLSRRQQDTIMHHRDPAVAVPKVGSSSR